MWYNNQVASRERQVKEIWKFSVKRLAEKKNSKKLDKHKKMWYNRQADWEKQVLKYFSGKEKLLCKE